MHSSDARGYSQHLFFGYNTYRQVWTGDREILTLDPLFGSYTGGVKPVTNFTIDKDGNVTINNATQGTILLLDMCSHCHIDLGDLGGAATVVDGTGAGQYRRIVSAGMRLSRQFVADAVFHRSNQSLNPTLKH